VVGGLLETRVSLVRNAQENEALKVSTRWRAGAGIRRRFIFVRASISNGAAFGGTGAAITTGTDGMQWPITV
jgi:hypothetical protein